MSVSSSGASVPTPAQVAVVKVNLEHIQLLNDYVYDHSNAKVINAYLLLSEKSSDLGLELSLEIFMGAFDAIGDLVEGPLGDFATSFVSGLLSTWASDPPGELNTTFADILTRLDKTSRQLDAHLREYHSDVPGNWTTQFSHRGKSASLSDLAEFTVPGNEDPKFTHLTDAALLGLDQQVWRTALVSNFEIGNEGDVHQSFEGQVVDYILEYEARAIVYDPSIYRHWRQEVIDGNQAWLASMYRLRTKGPFGTSVSGDACKYLFRSDSLGVVINKEGLYEREKIFMSLGIPGSVVGNPNPLGTWEGRRRGVEPNTGPEGR